MHTPTITSVSTHRENGRIITDISAHPAHEPTIEISPELRAWETEVYQADPTGGQASRY